MDTGGTGKGVAEILMGVREYLENRGGGIFTAADIVRDSLRYGSALVCAGIRPSVGTGRPGRKRRTRRAAMKMICRRRRTARRTERIPARMRMKDPPGRTQMRRMRRTAAETAPPLPLA